MTLMTIQMIRDVLRFHIEAGWMLLPILSLDTLFFGFRTSMIRTPERTAGFRVFLSFPAVFFGLVALAGLLAMSATRIILRERALDAEERALGEERRATEDEIARLKAGIAAGASPEAVERLAKERLNLKNPGEEVVVVAPGGGSSSTPSAPVAARFSLGALFGFSRWLSELVSFLGR